MAGETKEWESYEQVAAYLLDQIAEELGLERVEGKQHVYGSKRSDSPWEIDGKGVKVGGEGFIIIECRRHTTSRGKKSEAAELAYKILDTGADGAIYVSALGFQAGAKKVAAAEGIQEVRMDPTSTRTEYMLSFLNRIFVGAAATVKTTASAKVIVHRLDGTEEIYT